IAEVHLTMLNDRVVPVGDVDGAVGAHLDIDGPERRMARPDEVRLLRGREAGAVLLEHEAADAMAAEIVGDEVLLPLLGQMPAAEDLAAAVFWRAGIEAVQNARRTVSRRIACPWHDIVDALAAGAVGNERLAEAVEVMPPVIDPAAREDV